MAAAVSAPFRFLSRMRLTDNKDFCGHLTDQDWHTLHSQDQEYVPTFQQPRSSGQDRKIAAPRPPGIDRDRAAASSGPFQLVLGARHVRLIKSLMAALSVLQSRQQSRGSIPCPLFRASTTLTLPTRWEAETFYFENGSVILSVSTKIPYSTVPPSQRLHVTVFSASVTVFFQMEIPQNSL